MDFSTKALKLSVIKKFVISAHFFIILKPQQFHQIKWFVSIWIPYNSCDINDQPIPHSKSLRTSTLPPAQMIRFSLVSSLFLRCQRAINNQHMMIVDSVDQPIPHSKFNSASGILYTLIWKRSILVSSLDTDLKTCLYNNNLLHIYNQEFFSE